AARVPSALRARLARRHGPDHRAPSREHHAPPRGDGAEARRQAEHRVTVAILGGGSWGTALAIHLAKNAGAVRLWAREPEVVEGIRVRGRSPWYLPDVDIPGGVAATTDAAEAATGASVVVVAVPRACCAAALKNVMAIATGLVDGLGLGENARAALITRGLAEMTRLAVALGGAPATLSGLAGLGDLVLTCTGSLSRNRQLGIALTRGQTVAAVER